MRRWHLSGKAQWNCTRNTANQIFTIVEGSGVSMVEGREFHWSVGDMIAVPSWYGHSHTVHEDAVMLRVSDEPLMRMLDWFRVGAGWDEA
ncbi:MAG: cupin domain-containing protein [Aliidongia sp.]